MRRFTLFPFLLATAGALPLAAGCASPAPAGIASLAANERRVPTPAGELVVRETGSGRTALVLWHALYADPSMFESMIERLAPDYRLLVVAAPGHGPSELPAGPLTSAASGASGCGSCLPTSSIRDADRSRSKGEGLLPSICR
jgi:hypothetical protein